MCQQQMFFKCHTYISYNKITSHAERRKYAHIWTTYKPTGINLVTRSTVALFTDGNDDAGS